MISHLSWSRSSVGGLVLGLNRCAGAEFPIVVDPTFVQRLNRFPAEIDPENCACLSHGEEEMISSLFTHSPNNTKAFTDHIIWWYYSMYHTSLLYSSLEREKYYASTWKLWFWCAPHCTLLCNFICIVGRGRSSATFIILSFYFYIDKLLEV